MCTLMKKSFDKLSLVMTVDISKKYKNISKNKRVLAPVIDERIYLYINGIRLNEDEEAILVLLNFLIHFRNKGNFQCLRALVVFLTVADFMSMFFIRKKL